MELTEDSEMSAEFKQMPGIYPKEHIQYSKPDESWNKKKAELYVPQSCFMYMFGNCDCHTYESLILKYAVTDDFNFKLC